MKFVIAPDSYKNCLKATQVAEAMQKGLLSIYPDAETILIPLADGGEGTTEAIINATNGTIYKCPAHDPLMREIEAFYGITGDGETAVVEVAAASGIELLKSSELDVLNASSFGSGEVINAAIAKSNIKTLFIGLGGSATNDGGVGILQALGGEFFDKQGRIIPLGISGKDLINIESINLDKLNPRLQECRIIVGCDVKNPLTGDNGASAVFGPQKGATPEMVKFLDSGLANFRCNRQELPGDGAAGGIAFMLRNFLNAEIISGAESLLRLTNFERKIQNASLVLTGEGKSDSQTIEGKLCSVIAECAKKHAINSALISGAIRDKEVLSKLFKYIIQVTPDNMDKESAFAQAPELIKKAVQKLAEKI
ncbi:MAG: glycerate kinase [Lentisphaeria bacterium]|nr:glycerate kinase [Lentisphaeria bacterium]